MRHDGDGTTRAALADAEARSGERQRLAERVLALLPASRVLVCMLLDDPGTGAAIDRMLLSGLVAERMSPVTRKPVLVSRPRVGVSAASVEAVTPGRGTSKWSRKSLPTKESREQSDDWRKPSGKRKEARHAA